MKTETTTQNSFERFLCAKRVYCQHESCLNKAKVCRKVDGHNVVYCWQHDPEQVQSFIEWLESRGDAIVPTSFSEWLGTEDSIL